MHDALVSLQLPNLAAQVHSLIQTVKLGKQHRCAIKFSQVAKDAGAKAGPYQKDAQKAHQDIEANRNGAVYVTRQTPKGPVVVGKSGAEYPL